jgi:hypothetical protein
MEPEGSLAPSQKPSTGPYPEPDQSSPYTPSYLSSIVILSSRLRLGIPNCPPSFWGSHQNPICIPLLTRACCMPSPSHPLIVHSNYTWRRVQVMKLCSFIQPPITSSLFGPNILPSTLFSNTLSLCSSLNVRDQVNYKVLNCGLLGYETVRSGRWLSTFRMSIMPSCSTLKTGGRGFLRNVGTNLPCYTFPCPRRTQSKPYKQLGA